MSRTELMIPPAVFERGAEVILPSREVRPIWRPSGARVAALGGVA